MTFPWKWIVGAMLLVYAVLLSLSSFESTDCSWGAGAAMLGELAAAQEEFRRTDADRNGISDYWRGDAAGLYALAPGGNPLKFINLSTAQADRRPASALPEGHANKNGYWVQALGFQDETSPSPSRFAYCSWWEWQSPTSWTFIVDHHGIVYARRGRVPEPLQFCPDDPPAEGWVTLERARKIRWTERNRLWWVRFWNAL